MIASSVDKNTIRIGMVNTEQLLALLREKQVVLPLYWTWSKTEDPILLQKTLRDLVGRRATFMADIQGQKSIVKLFYDKQGIRHARREVKGLELLRNSGVATSRVMQCVVLKEGAMLTLSYLEDTKPFSELWDTWSSSDKKTQLSHLLDNLKKMYARGIYQDDLHLDNILFDGDQLYMVDGMGITLHREKNALSMDKQLNNLAEFFLELSFSDQKILWAALETTVFFQASNHLEKQLRKKIIQKSLYKQHKFQDKVWRKCSAFSIGLLNDYQYVVSIDKKKSFEAMFHHVTEHEEYFTPLKQGRTCTLFRYQWGKCDWVVKRYNIKSWQHGVMRSLRMTRAAVSWQNANRLQLLHILTPTPIGMLQKKWGALRRQAYFVMEYIPGKSLKEYFSTYDDSDEQQNQIIVKVAEVIAALKHNRLRHGDFKADNWWVHEDKLYLLDLDSLRSYRRELFFSRAFNSDMKRFLKNWQDNPVLEQKFIAVFKESKLL